MLELTEKLVEISDQIANAENSGDYDSILKLDKMRKMLIDEIFAVGVKGLSEENMTTIKSIAENNEKMIARISIAATKNAEKVHNKIKAIRGYKP